MILFVRSFFNRFSLLLLLFSFALTVGISGCEISGCKTKPAEEAKVTKRMKIEHEKKAPVKKVVRKKKVVKKKRPVKTARPDVKWVSPKKATIKRKSAAKAEPTPKETTVAKTVAVAKKVSAPRKKTTSSAVVFKPVSGTNYVISLSSYKERSKAAGLVRKLTAEGYNAYITETDVKGTKWYRVRCGFFEGYTEATRVKNELVKRYFAKGAWVDKPTTAEVAEFAK